MKKLFILLFSVLSLIVFADNAKIALLQPLSVPESSTCNPMEISMVRGELRKAFGEQSDFQVLTRMDVDAMLKEQGYQNSGMINDAQRKQIGVMTGAQYICVSSITKYATQLYIEAYLVNVETGRMTNSATQNVNIKNEDYSTLPDACSELAKSMLKGIASTAHKQPVADNSLSTNKDYIENAFGVQMKMIWVEGGEFMMGCTSEQGSDCAVDEKNVRRVKLDGYYIGMLEVTQGQWEKVMGTSILDVYKYNKGEHFFVDEGTGDTVTSPFWFGQELNVIGNSYPMHYITSTDAADFCRKLSNKAGRRYVLPTEAQWEYAARGGQKASQTKYAGSNNIQDVAWYEDNSQCPTNKYCINRVGMKNPNELGIYDMSGNVWEWCGDIYSDTYFTYDTDNPKGPTETDDPDGYTKEVMRGGSVFSKESNCRVSMRSWGYGGINFDEDVGFRVVCIPLGDPNKKKENGSGKSIPDGYVDLGLPSGTLWKRNNEDCGLISFNEAWNLYGNKMPTLDQWTELKWECVWTWTGDGYKVIGPSGDYIILPAEDKNDGNTRKGGLNGSYWLSTAPGENYKAHAYRQSFHSEGMYTVSLVFRNEKGSVHLVQ